MYIDWDELVNHRLGVLQHHVCSCGCALTYVLRVAVEKPLRVSAL